MFLGRIVPTWHEIENRITDQMGFQGGATYRTPLNERASSLSLNIRRINSVRSAFIQAEWEAGRLLRQRFSDLDIASVLDELIEVVTQMAMIVAGSVLVGGAIGAGTGALFGGVGALPMGAAGAAMGLQVSTWILGILGLTSVAEFFAEGLPRIGEYYLTGINIAWEGPRGEEGLNPFSQDDPFAEDRAAHHIALGHVEIVVLLLGAIVAYITRGRGNANVLAQEMRASPKGARLAQWMLKHEDALNPPDTDPTSPYKSPDSNKLNDAVEHSLDHPSPPTEPKPPKRNGQLFAVCPGINMEALLANASEDLLSISAIAVGLADNVDGSRRSVVLALSRMADGVHLLVERALDHLDDPEMAAIFARQQSNVS